MIKSMTGFASLTHEDEHATVSVTVRTVNHRFLDLQLRLPAPIAGLEGSLRALLQRRLVRGRVELQVSVQPRAVPTVVVELNEEVVTGLSEALDRLRDRGLVSGSLTPGDLLRLPQAISVRDRPQHERPEEGNHLAGSVSTALELALDGLEAMRVHEGQHLRTDLYARRVTLATLLERLVAAAGEGGTSLEQRLQERVREVGQNLSVDEALLAQEIVRVVQRSDISEEVARFRAHLAHWDALTDGEEACGRKLDFLIQELNREVNTIGAKADGVQVSELVIEAKAELEKLREQIQNVE